MVAKSGPLTLSTNAGELDPLVHERVDIKTRRAGMKAMRNIEPVPQGGFRLMPATRMQGCVRRAMELVPGLASPTTSFGPHSSDATVLTLAIDPAETIAAVTLDDWSLSAGQSASVRVEIEVGGSWVTLGGDLPMTDTAVTFTVAKPPDAPVSVTGVRVQLITSTSVTVASGTLSVRRETDTLAMPRFETLSMEAGQTYTFALIEGFADVWRMNMSTGRAAHVGAFLHGMSEAELADQHAFGSGETLGFFAEDLKTPRALRRGADHAWQVDDWPYGPIGTVNYGGDYPKTDDIHEITISWSGSSEFYLSLTVEGEDTQGVPSGGDPASVTWSTYAAAVQTAIRALPSMTDDVTVVDGGSPLSGSRVLEVTFGGALSGDSYEVLASIPNTVDAAAVVTNTQIGTTEGEAVVSDLRGYPAEMTEAQQRAIYGGIKARPAAVLGSALGEYFNINVQGLGADQAFIEAIRVARTEKINHFVWDKYLIVFTDQNEYFINNRDLSKDQPKNVVQATSYGSRRSCRPVRIDGEVFYVSKNGQILYAANYDDVQTSYLSAPVSLLHSHFINDMQRIGSQKGTEATDGYRFFGLRGDGKLIQAMIIRGQDVFGFSWWLTPGTVRDFVTDADNYVWLAVQRAGPNGPMICLETFEEGQLLHSATDVGPSDSAGRVSGLERFEGQEIWAVADGYVLGPYTVSSATIDLPSYAADVTVGFWTAPYAETLGQLITDDRGNILRRPGRIATVSLRLRNTTQLALGANGGAVRDVTLTRAGDTIDAPPPPYNGLQKITGLRGRVNAPTVAITQLRPGALQVENFMVEVSG
jgi:hypothetical protein